MIPARQRELLLREKQGYGTGAKEAVFGAATVQKSQKWNPIFLSSEGVYCRALSDAAKVSHRLPEAIPVPLASAGASLKPAGLQHPFRCSGLGVSSDTDFRSFEDQQRTSTCTRSGVLRRNQRRIGFDAQQKGELSSKKEFSVQSEKLPNPNGLQKRFPLRQSEEVAEGLSLSEHCGRWRCQGTSLSGGASVDATCPPIDVRRPIGVSGSSLTYGYRKKGLASVEEQRLHLATVDGRGLSQAVERQNCAGKRKGRGDVGATNNSSAPRLAEVLSQCRLENSRGRSSLVSSTETREEKNAAVLSVGAPQGYPLTPKVRKIGTKTGRQSESSSTAIKESRKHPNATVLKNGSVRSVRRRSDGLSDGRRSSTEQATLQAGKPVASVLNYDMKHSVFTIAAACPQEVQALIEALSDIKQTGGLQAHESHRKQSSSRRHVAAQTSGSTRSTGKQTQFREQWQNRGVFLNDVQKEVTRKGGRERGQKHSQDDSSAFSKKKFPSLHTAFPKVARVSSSGTCARGKRVQTCPPLSSRQLHRRLHCITRKRHEGLVALEKGSPLAPSSRLTHSLSFPLFLGNISLASSRRQGGGKKVLSNSGRPRASPRFVVSAGHLYSSRALHGKKHPEHEEKSRTQKKFPVTDATTAEGALESKATTFKKTECRSRLGRVVSSVRDMGASCQPEKRQNVALHPVGTNRVLLKKTDDRRAPSPSEATLSQPASSSEWSSDRLRQRIIREPKLEAASKEAPSGCPVTTLNVLELRLKEYERTPKNISRVAPGEDMLVSRLQVGAQQNVDTQQPACQKVYAEQQRRGRSPIKSCSAPNDNKSEEAGRENMWEKKVSSIWPFKNPDKLVASANEGGRALNVSRHRSLVATRKSIPNRYRSLSVTQREVPRSRIEETTSLCRVDGEEHVSGAAEKRALSGQAYCASSELQVGLRTAMASAGDTRFSVSPPTSLPGASYGGVSKRIEEKGNLLLALQVDKDSGASKRLDRVTKMHTVDHSASMVQGSGHNKHGLRAPNVQKSPHNQRIWQGVGRCSTDTDEMHYNSSGAKLLDPLRVTSTILAEKLQKGEKGLKAEGNTGGNRSPGLMHTPAVESLCAIMDPVLAAAVAASSTNTANSTLAPSTISESWPTRSAGFDNVCGASREESGMQPRPQDFRVFTSVLPSEKVDSLTRGQKERDENNRKERPSIKRASVSLGSKLLNEDNHWKSYERNVLEGRSMESSSAFVFCDTGASSGTDTSTAHTSASFGDGEEESAPVVASSVVSGSTREGGVLPPLSNLPVDPPETAISQPENTLIIWDWDDTLLPTYNLTVEHRCAPTDPGGLPEHLREPLAQLEENALLSLRLSMQKGCTILVTNASFRWLADSAIKYFPRLWGFVQENRVKILSARDICQPLGASQWDWKRLLIRDQVNQFFKHLEIPLSVVEEAERRILQYAGQRKVEMSIVGMIHRFCTTADLTIEFTSNAKKDVSAVSSGNCGGQSRAVSRNRDSAVEESGIDEELPPVAQAAAFFLNSAVADALKLDRFVRVVGKHWSINPRVLAMTGLLVKTTPLCDVKVERKKLSSSDTDHGIPCNILVPRDSYYLRGVGELAEPPRLHERDDQLEERIAQWAQQETLERHLFCPGFGMLPLGSSGLQGEGVSVPLPENLSLAESLILGTANVPSANGLPAPSLFTGGDMQDNNNPGSASTRDQLLPANVAETIFSVTSSQLQAAHMRLKSIENQMVNGVDSGLWLTPPTSMAALGKTSEGEDAALLLEEAELCNYSSAILPIVEGSSDKPTTHALVIPSIPEGTLRLDTATLVTSFPYVVLAEGGIRHIQDMFPPFPEELGLRATPCSVISIGDGPGEREAVFEAMALWDTRQRKMIMRVQHVREMLLKLYRRFILKLQKWSKKRLEEREVGQEGTHIQSQSGYPLKLYQKLVTPTPSWTFKSLKLSPHQAVETLCHTHEALRMALLLCLGLKHSIDVKISSNFRAYALKENRPNGYVAVGPSLSSGTVAPVGPSQSYETNSLEAVEFHGARTRFQKTGILNVDIDSGQQEMNTEKHRCVVSSSSGNSMFLTVPEETLGSYPSRIKTGSEVQPLYSSTTHTSNQEPFDVLHYDGIPLEAGERKLCRLPTLEDLRQNGQIFDNGFQGLQTRQYAREKQPLYGTRNTLGPSESEWGDGGKKASRNPCQADGFPCKNDRMTSGYPVQQAVCREHGPTSVAQPGEPPPLLDFWYGSSPSSSSSFKRQSLTMNSEASLSNTSVVTETIKKSRQRSLIRTETDNVVYNSPLSTSPVSSSSTLILDAPRTLVMAPSEYCVTAAT